MTLWLLMQTAALPGVAAPGADPLEGMVQGGGLGLACYLVFWTTRTLSLALNRQSDLIDALRTAVDNNTHAIGRMESRLQRREE